METLFIILGILQVFVLACIIFWVLGYAAKKYPTYWKSVFPSQSGDPEPKTSFLRHYGKESENKEINWVWKSPKISHSNNWRGYYVFDNPDDDPMEDKITKSDVEKGQKENLSTYWNWISKTQCNIKYGKLHDKCFVCNDCTSK